MHPDEQFDFSDEETSPAFHECLRLKREKWDTRFLRLALEIAEWSKDPSTRVGAVIVNQRDIMCTGYNGFPRGVSDAPEHLACRETKYPRTVHAEQNAIYRARDSLVDCTIYTTLFPCATCAGGIIQKGISRVVSIVPEPEVAARWADAWMHSRDMFFQAGVSTTEYPLDVVLIRKG